MFGEANGVRASTKRSSCLREGFVGSAHRHQIVREPVVGADVVRTQLQSSMELFLDARPIPFVIELGKSQRGVGFNHRVVNAESFLCSHLRL
jgi:hypothetical protein